MGADRGVAVTVEGAASASRASGAPHILLVGDEAVLRRQLTLHPHERSRIRIVHAPTFVEQGAAPRDALDRVPKCSVMRAAALVRDGDVDGSVLRYVNRLSDFLFVAARHTNRLEGVNDVPWTPPAS